MLLQLLLALDIASQPASTCPDTSDVGRFVAQFLVDRPPAEKIPRGAFVLVCGDTEAYGTGFGKTASGVAVNPDQTLFRAASNSKLVTATAAMQLAASNRWKLSDDVNRYLPLSSRLKDGYGRQVTIEDLLTHTAGFEDKFSGGIGLESHRVSLGQFFERNVPKRVRPAGTEVSYSNIGIALLGYAVEAASDESFDTYAEKHIFAPLGMTRSTFRQPIPSDWSRDVASNPPRGARGIVFLPYPAASLVTTPADMGRFIAAHLSGAGGDTKRILTPAAMSVMHSSHWRAAPTVPGVAYGFFEGEMNGRRTLFHTGDSGDHSVVFLLPEERIGFYLVYTGSDEQTVVREHFTRAFVDRYFPPVKLAAEQPLQISQDVASFVGRYRGTAHSSSNYEKVKATFYQAGMSDGGNGTLLVSPPGGGQPVTLHPKAPLVFVGDSGEVVAFRKDSKGKVSSFTLIGSIWDPQSFDRIGLLDDGRLHVAAFVALVIALLARLLFVPLSALARRIRHQPKPTYSRTERNWWRLSGMVSLLLFLTPIIGIGVAFLSFRPGAVAVPRAAFVIGLWLTVVLLAGLTLLPVTVVAWKNHYWSATRRIVFSVTAIGFVIGTALFGYWRVIPF